MFVRKIVITGNTAVATRELEKLAKPYEGRSATFSDLLALRDQITQAYIQRGFVTSGAILPDQRIHDGVVTLSIVEGELRDLTVETNGRLAAPYLRGRLREAAAGVVNVYKIEEALQLLKQDPVIARVEAELLPGKARGESILRVRVSEASSFAARFQLDNEAAPSVGSEEAKVSFRMRNLTGYGDSELLNLRISEGLREVSGTCEVPVGSSGTLVEFHGRGSWSEVVEEDMEDLDIKSRSRTLGVTLGQTLYRTIRSRLGLTVTGEWRRSQDFLLGSGFQFSEGPSEDGESKETVLRLGQSWTYGGWDHALALRYTLSLGLKALGATEHNGDTPDGQFLAWLGQFQWAWRLPKWARGTELLTRGELQLSNRALLGMEKFAIGGRSTVRGYRESELVGDKGAVFSVEARISLARRADGASLWELAPFLDMGRSWNVHGASDGEHTLKGVGVGMRLMPSQWVHAELYWGHKLTDVARGGSYNLQDDGLHFALSMGTL